MSLTSIKGNDKIRQILMTAVKEGTISHAYIFEGDAESDKLQLAENFTKAILCQGNNTDCCDSCNSCIKIDHGNHEDVIYCRSEGGRIKDEGIESLQSRLKKKPYVGSRNIAIIENADTMTLRAQNRLLKTLEEPSMGTVIILLSQNTENLTSTILSRCIVYKLNSSHISEDLNETHEINIDSIMSIADMTLSKEPFFKIEKELASYMTDATTALCFLDTLEKWFRDLVFMPYVEDGSLIWNPEYMNELEERSRLYRREDILKSIDWIEEAKRDIARNMNIGYTLKNMILKMTV
ncbi:MAG: hypothetical protein ACOX5F_07970 [Anaerovoracaceae bacterium]|jgi:DNA polymerase-3 subunit delta'